MWMSTLPKYNTVQASISEGHSTLYNEALEGAKAGMKEFAKAVCIRLDAR